MQNGKKEKKCDCGALKIKHLLFALYLLFLFTPLGFIFYFIAHGMFGGPVVVSMLIFIWGYLVAFSTAFLTGYYRG